MTEANSTLHAQRAVFPTLGISWPLLIGFLSIAFVLGSAKLDVLADPDTYWHIAAGRWMLAHGALPTVDPFSHSMPGAPWLTHEWLSELVIAAVFNWAGWTGLGSLVALIFACTLAYLMRFLLARMEPVHALVFTSFAGAMMVGHLLARPHVLVWPLIALWVGALVKAVEQNRLPSLWLIPAMVLWANLHGSFMLGLALTMGLALDATVSQAAGRWRPSAWRWGWFFALTVAAALMTPGGWQGLMFPFEVMKSSFTLDLIGEFSSPNFHHIQMLEVWLLLALAMACTGRLHLPWVRLLLLLSLTHMALKNQRYISILGLVAPFLVALPLARQWREMANKGPDFEPMDRVFRALAVPAQRGAVACLAFLTTLLIGVAAQTEHFKPAPDITPDAAMQAVRRLGISGPVLNSHEFGGYLILNATPVFIDGRTEIYGDALMKRYQAATMLTEPQALPTLLEDFHIRWTLLHPGTPALALLDRLPGWTRVYADDVAVVHVRTP